MDDGELDLSLHAIVPAELNGKRFDAAAAALFSDFSRGRIQEWIKSGELTLDGHAEKAKVKVFSEQELSLKAKLQVAEDAQPEPVDFEVVFEDEHVVVVNKAVGLVVHPGAGNPNGTLLNGLLYRYPELANVPRAGIVHRLDKDTSGLMVVARTLQAHTSLVAQLQARTVDRRYEAIAEGCMTGGGVIDKNLGRHPTHRTKIAAVKTGGREAITHYRVIERFKAYTHIELKLETGRTHQIRVHMAELGYPLLGDPLYGRGIRFPKGASEELRNAISGFRRQALHAFSLGFEHPATGDQVEFEVDTPDDIAQFLQLLIEEQEND